MQVEIILLTLTTLEISTLCDTEDTTTIRSHGYYYLQSRYYDPSWGRFLNADQQITDDILGANLYTYCLNNPINYYDPDGFMTAVLPYVGQVAQQASEIDWWAATVQLVYGVPAGLTYIKGEGTRIIEKTAVPPVGQLTKVKATPSAGDSFGYVVSTPATPPPPNNNKKPTSTKTSSAKSSPSAKAVAPKIVGFTKHGINSAIYHDGVGVSPKSLLDTTRFPKEIIQQSGGVIKVIGNTSVVVLNAGGKVITTWATSSAGIGMP